MAGLSTILLNLGGPLLAKAIGDKLGPAAGVFADGALKALAEALGTPATPDDITERLEALPPTEAAAIVQQVDQQLVEQMRIMAGDMADYRQLIAADAKSEGLLARIWRPLFAIVFTLVYAMVLVTICWLLWTRQLATLTNLAEVTSFMTFAFLAGCAVIGVQVWQREKTERGA